MIDFLLTSTSRAASQQNVKESECTCVCRWARGLGDFRRPDACTYVSQPHSADAAQSCFMCSLTPFIISSHV